jgi:hypothetical protein
MNIRLLALFIIVSIIGLSACKKNDDAPVVTSKVGLNVINASPDVVNIYLNGTRLNNTSNIEPGISTGYYNVPVGEQTYQLKKAFNTSSSTVETLFSKTIDTAVTATDRSLFVVDETAANAFITVDNLQADTVANTCFVRFVNASPDARHLDLAVGDTIQFKNVAFKAATGFISVSVNATVDSLKPLKVFVNGIATPLISGHVNLGAGRSYTFYAQGKASGTGAAVFSLGTTINFN